MLLPLADQLKEVLRHRGRELPETEIIDNEQVDSQVPTEAPLKRPVGMATGEVLKQLAGFAVGDLKLLLARRVAQGLQQVAFPDPDGPGETHRVVLPDPLTGGQFPDLARGNLGVVVKIKRR